MKVINANPRIGFKAIINQVKKEKLTITDVVFIIAPRINAAGRMKHGLHAVNLLTETNLKQAEIFASEIEKYNLDRRTLDQEITKEALLQIQENKEEERVTSVVYKDTWHKGVIGIVASRLIETYYRPTLVFTKSGDKLAASARSVKGFDVYNALQDCSEYIEQFGGHKYAAGLTLLKEQYDGFKEQFEKVVAATITSEQLSPEIQIDAKIELHQISPKLLRIINQFAPFGPGNMTPVFMAENVQDTGYGKTVGQENKHLKLTLNSGGVQKPIGAIGFNLGDKLSQLKMKNRFDIVFNLDENEWKGNISLQLKLKDLK